MGIEYKNVTARVHTGWRDVFTVPAGKQAILSSANITNLYPSDASATSNTTFGLRMVDTSNNVTSITNDIVINKGSATQMLAGKLVLTANQKLQVAHSPSSAYSLPGFNLSGNVLFNNWNSIGLPGFIPRSIEANGAIRIAVGSGGSIARSTDSGKTWSRITSPATQQLNKVKFLNNLWIAVGNSGNVVTSSDGINWTKQTYIASGTNLQNIYYFGSAYFIYDTTKVVRSTDAVTWTTVYTGSYNIGGLAYNGTAYLAFAIDTTATDTQLVYSTNGTSWSVPATGTYLSSQQRFGLLMTIGTTFYGFVITPSSSGVLHKIITSTDGVSWSLFNNAAFIKYYELNGNNTLTSFEGTSETFTGVNGLNWVFLYSGTSNPFGTVSSVFYSSDGTNWTENRGTYYAPQSFMYDSTYGYQVHVSNLTGLYNIGNLGENPFATGNNYIGDLVVSYVEVTP